MEFYKKIEEDIKELINETESESSFLKDKERLINNRLGTNYLMDFDEARLWRKSLFLSSNAIMLLNYDPYNRLAKRVIKECAEVYENFYRTSEKFDKQYCAILAALCYDISGYQANALCLIREVPDYELLDTNDLDSEDLLTDNYILGNITKLLNKKLYYAYEEVNLDTQNENEGKKLYNKAMYSFYNAALYGIDNEFLPIMNEAYTYFLKQGNSHISHLLFLLMYRLTVFDKRSIWRKMGENVDISNPQWISYLKILTINPYKDNEIQDSKDRISLFEFWLSQIDAIDSGYLLDNQNYVIQMPTSAGKTLIAELAILNALVRYPNKKCIYVAPYRALSNEKEQELSKKFSLLGYSVTSLNGSYELDDVQVFIMDEADVLLATPEKLDILFRVRPEFFNELSLIVIDEGHMIGDYSERSALLEFLLIRLKMKFPNLNTLFISAVLSEKSISELSRWISGKSDNVISSPTIDGFSWEPTRRFISKFYWEEEIGMLEYINLPFNVDKKTTKNLLTVQTIGKSKFPKKDKGVYNKSQTAALIAYNLLDSGGTLIFCSRPDWSYSVASKMLEYIEYLVSKNQSVLPYFELNENSSSYKLALKWYGDDSIITKSLKRGIGIHNGIMFEPVKRAVEKDYRSGVLRVLVSTNTIGQGINFPIKNLIIHSLVQNHSKKDYKAISVRDFWNIIGRAGRAGLETEGEVIFLSNSEKDDALFEKYINKNNLEDIKSYFSIVIEKLVSNRINPEEYSDLLEIGSEAHIIHILAEELYENKGMEEIVELISDNSLFKFQTNSEDIMVIASEFKNIASNINGRKTKGEIVAFSKTGLCLSSNETILEYIQENIDYLKEVIEKDNYLLLIKIIFNFLYEHGLREMKSNHTVKFENLSLEKGFEFIEAWLNGLNIRDLKQLWIDADDKYKPDSNRMELFIQELLYYRYPWGVSAFITLLSYKLDIVWDNIPKNIKSLPMFLRYGVSSPNACIAMALGIGDRELAIKLSETFSSQTMKGFIFAITNLTKERLERKEFSSLEIEEIIQIGLKYNLKKRDYSRFVFEVRGIRFNEFRKLTSKDIIKNQVLEYKREITNQYDPFAIAIYMNDQQVGYVPRDVAKIIATDMDLNKTEYSIRVLKVIPFGNASKTWNRIRVIMKKEN